MFLRKIVKRFRRQPAFVSTGNYMEDYRRHTGERVRHDPQAAIGGMWDEIGELQIDFLKSEGLKPSDTLLDIGCGTLRGGRHFIRYLDSGNYTGTEMVGACLDAARQLLVEESLTGKSPTLIHVPDGNFRFDGLGAYDFILAQSVFTHLHEPMIEECFANIGKVLRGRFYFTFNSPDTDHPLTSEKDFTYPFAFFAELGRKNGLKAEDVSARYPHPRKQRMAVAAHQ